MANTYTQLNIHVVFAVKYRKALIDSSWKTRLLQYVTQIIQAKEQKLVQINCVSDHIHILIGLQPAQSLSALVQLVKSESTKWIIREKLCTSTFAWQRGFGAFACAQRDVPLVIRYIQNQEKHHSQIPLLTEYTQFLLDQEIKFEQSYVFQVPE